MNDSLNKDFEKKYKNLVSLPINLPMLFMYSLMLGVLSGFIDVGIARDDDLILLGFVLTGLLIYVLGDFSEKRIKNYCIKKQFSSNQLKRADNIANYIHKIIAIVTIIFWVRYFY